jgi:hypothetical protein
MAFRVAECVRSFNASPEIAGPQRFRMPFDEDTGHPALIGSRMEESNSDMDAVVARYQTD